MKYIKIFEDFTAEPQINEAKETPLPGGFININFDGSSEDENAPTKDKVVYFKTNTSAPEKNLGSPNTLDVTSKIGQTSTSLSFASDNFVDEDRHISMKISDYKKIAAGNPSSQPQIFAKNPAEATAKAYEILAAATYLTETPGEPKVLGDMIRAFFEIRKLYPAYISKNALFKGFLQGIINGFSNPNFGEYSKYDNWVEKIRDKKYNEEIRKALTDAGVLKPAA